MVISLAALVPEPDKPLSRVSDLLDSICRRASGKSMMRRPKAIRPLATHMASCPARRISALENRFEVSIAAAVTRCRAAARGSTAR